MCLQAVQKALIEGANKNHAQLLFAPQDATAAANAHSNVATRKAQSKGNIEGLLLYRPMIVQNQNPWEPPKDINRLIDDLIVERKTYLVRRAYNPWGQNDAHKTRAPIDEIKGALKPLSNAFHVLLKRLVPRAKITNYLFTRIKGARMEHILRRREWEVGRRSAKRRTSGFR
jgi:hypothetical protein